jgi:hypothetical protein
MTFDADERGVETSQPREFIEISHGTTTYRVACGQRDIYYNGALFAAITPAARGEQVTPTTTGNAEMAISLPSSHALVARYLAVGGVPPRQILVTVRRLQVTSGQVEQIWIGYATSLSIDGHEAKLLVPSRAGQSLTRKLPVILVDTACQHILYDAGCRADRNANTYAATVGAVDGRDITVAFGGGHPSTAEWARGGELVHVPSGERMTITDQVGSNITMQSPIAEMKTGDAVQVVAGCAHDLTACFNTFNNVVNYGGLPAMPSKNPFFPTGTGVGEVK